MCGSDMILLLCIMLILLLKLQVYIWGKWISRNSPSSSSVAPGRATKNGSEGTAPSSHQFFAFPSTKSICIPLMLKLETYIEVNVVVKVVRRLIKVVPW